MMTPSMVINDFHILCTGVRPTKTDPPLIVDANTELTRPIAFKRFKMVAGRNP